MLFSRIGRPALESAFLSSSKHIALNRPARISPRAVSGRSQSTISKAVTPSSASLYYALAIASVASGVAGYCAARGIQASTTVPESLGSPKYGLPDDFRRGIEELKASFDREDVVSTNPDDLLIHGFSPNVWHPGTSWRQGPQYTVPYPSLPGVPHSVVVYPLSTEDVVKIVNVANKYRMPVIPYSGATSLEGQFVGVRYFPLPRPCCSRRR